ncbi:hypothetical protein DLM45_10695 [Hyphomicrobium methylovorum]|nr:hypothetical protein [Hyphomicrobium methylovorum]
MPTVQNRRDGKLGFAPCPASSLVAVSARFGKLEPTRREFRRVSSFLVAIYSGAHSRCPGLP